MLKYVQFVQNAAARLIAGTRRCERITPVLQKLHWLPVRRRSTKLKLACLVRQSLAGHTPSYLASDIQLTADTGRPQLRSASERIMCCSTHTQQLRRQKLFCCRRARVWNASPSHMRWDIQLQTYQACTERTYV